MDPWVRAQEEETVAGFGALEDHRGRSVRFTVLRSAADGAWCLEITPHLAGTASAHDVRGFALGVLDTLEAVGASRADRAVLAGGARALLAALDG